MASGSAIPYHLRPHKAVDRRLFIDLLQRCERWRALTRDVYISMGAYPLEDHKLVHRALGISRLITFDGDENVVKRQDFNKPVNSCHCIKGKSGEVIQKLDTILDDAGCSDADGIIFWLDYVEPKKLGEQIREFSALLDKLTVGDIVRVTVNAHLPALGEGRNDVGNQIETAELQQIRFNKLHQRIGEFLPSTAKPADMTVERLPLLIAQAFGRAAGQALPITGGVAFAPLSIVRYSDGQQMLSMTGMICERDKKVKVREKLDLESWPFSSADWATVHSLLVPDLTLRERLFLERAIANADHKELADKLGFHFGEDINVSTFLQNYRDFYRFYPTLLTAEA